MSTSTPLPQTPLWDPSQGDLATQHGINPSGLKNYPPETPQQLHAAGWMDCPRCHKFWLSPENKQLIQEHGGYFTCPRCKLTTDILDNLPWHGVTEEEYYPRSGTGGGTAVGLPLADVGQIAENVVRQMKEIPGYGPIVWWHAGPAAGGEGNSSLDGATPEWGIEVKGQTYDSAGHFWDPRNGADTGVVERKNQAAAEMGLQGILGVFVLLNFRNDKADVYVKPMPLTPWRTPQGQIKQGIVRWHKRTGEKVATGIAFPNPYKDPSNPAPGPYSMADYYQQPLPIDYQPPEPAPF